MRQIGVDELTRNGEDQAGLDLWIEWAEKVWKRQAGNRVGKRRDGWLHAVARKINPVQKMSNLISPMPSVTSRTSGCVTFRLNVA